MGNEFWRYYDDVVETEFFHKVIGPWMDVAKVGDISPFVMPNGMRLKREAEQDVTFCECCGPEIFQWVMVKA